MTKASIGTKNAFPKHLFIYNYSWRGTFEWTLLLSSLFILGLFDSQETTYFATPTKNCKGVVFPKGSTEYRVNACLRAAKIIEIRNWSAHYLFAPAAKGYDLLLGIKTWCKKVGHKTFTHMLLLIKGWFSVMLGFWWQKSKEANSQIPSDWDVQIGNF